MSLAVYDDAGRLVRSLLTGAPRAAGEHTARWDGLDRYGNPLPAGTYTWKVLATTGLRAEFITQVGQNPDPVWEKGVSNHEPPMAAAVDATGVYRIGTFDEGAHAGVKTDLDGRYLWTTNREKADPWCRFGAALTLVGGELFELIHNGTVYRYEAATGASRTSSNGAGLWNLRWDGGPAVVEGKAAEPLRRYVERTGMDLAGATEPGLLIVSYRRHNAVRWFSAADGKLVAEAAVPEPVAVAGKADGTALVISNGAVVALARDGGEPVTVIPADRLTSPWRLCVSPATGDIFVAENSALADRSDHGADGGAEAEAPRRQPHHQVKRFSPDGKLLAAIGRPEGRQDGAYVATDFRGITDIEADHVGGFVVTEGHHQPPRRSARFDAGGALLREWYGAQQYGVLACPEPGNPQYVWIHASADRGAMMRVRVDYANKTWRIEEIYQDCLTRNPYWRGGHQLFRAVARDGRIHFFGNHKPFLATVYDPAAKTMRVSNAGTVEKGSGSEMWNDLNDDGLPQPAEVQRIGRPVAGSVAGPDFTLFTTPFPTDFQAGPKLTPESWTAGGTPVYAFDRAETWPAWEENGDRYRCWDVVAAPGGGWFGCFSDAFKAEHDNNESHGAWYINSTSGIDRLVKWDRDWRQVWSVGRHSPDFDHEPGSLIAPRGFVGVTHGCVVLAEASDEELARCTVWTDDGLYVDEFLRVPIDTLPKEIHGVYNGLEFTRGQLAEEPDTGQVLYYAVSTAGGAPIYRISGWDGWHRQQGQVTLAATPAAAAKRDGTGLKAEYFNNPDCSGEPALIRTDGAVYFHWLKDRDPRPPGIDGPEFSCRWTGQVEAPTTDRYRIVFEDATPWRGTGTPAWLKIWLGGTLIVDTTAGLARPTSYGVYGEASLRAGERYDLRVECGYKGDAVAKLCWDTPALDRRAILPQFLHPTPGPKRDIGAAPAAPPEVMADFGFEEQDGALARSRVGVEVFGRLTGETRRAPGKAGGGIGFRAGGPYAPALFPIDEELRLPDANYTVAFWVRTTAPDVRLCETKRYSSYNNRWSDHVVSLEGGRPRFHLQGDEPIVGKVPVNDAAWHHVATTVGPGGQKLYVDGQLAGTGKLARRTRTSNRLGLDVGPGPGPGVVTIDELKVFGRPLTPDEVARLAR